ncbi:DUF7573 domain-containing protein [Halorussus caseinilyticus]|uniref:DUF7573 domain-containing protein n=1 Tax=Halorussus caseinilyticus TaxID=3034025 RepID=A0ABD5WM17_9EURY|nr:hypothetical protein [Halorussus sp. DT72]
MPEDVPLDAFDSTESGDDAEEVSDAETPDPEEFDPAVSTYDWSPAGGECAACGEVVERRWRSGGERDGSLVCPDCKEW